MLRPFSVNAFLFLIIAFSTQPISAQSTQVSLSWKANPISFTNQDNQRIHVPTFDGAVHSFSSQGLPLFIIEQNVASDGNFAYVLENEVTEVVTNPSFDMRSIPSHFEVKQIVTTERKKDILTVQVCPIRFANNQVERLISFSLRVEKKSSSSQHRAGNAFASQSVLSQGNWFKVSVVDNGVYKLDYNFVKNNSGVDPATVSFNNIGVFGNGGGMLPEVNNAPRHDDLQENAILRVDNNNNGRMDADDYILFYAQGPNEWKYDNSLSRFVFVKNLYSDKNFYFISTTEGSGKTINAVANGSSPTHFVNSFTDYAVREMDEYNTINSGREWLGDKMSSSKPSFNFSFNFPNLLTSEPVKYRSMVAATSRFGSNIEFAVNGANIFNHFTSGISDGAYKPGFMPSNQNGTFIATGPSLNFSYSFSNPDQGSSSVGYLDKLEINAQRALTMVGDAMVFRNPSSVGAGNVTNFTLSNANNNVRIWNITDPTNITANSFDLNGSAITFNSSTSNLKEFLAVNIFGNFSSPTAEGGVSTQNLHGLGFQDYIIVTDASLISAANRLADFHRQRNQMRVVVVDKNQIYNEFSSGKQDITAIRDFVRMFYERAGNDSVNLPKYLCLFGDASYDFKNRLKDNTNTVPTYQSYHSQYPLSSYVTDDFFGCLDPSEGGDMNNPQRGDVAVGRIPVITLSEANGVVDKIINYKSIHTLGEWRNITTTIGDDEDGEVHANQADRLGEYTRINHPAYNIEKIILDAYQQQSTPGGDRYPDANIAILNAVNRGTLVLSYTGHGGPNNWAHERIFNLSDIQRLKNKDRLPLFVTATCDFSPFDNPEKKSAGEVLMTMTEGGGIGLITTTRAVFSDANDRLQNALYSQLFVNINGKKPTMGQLMMNAKNAVMSSGDMENNRKFSLLGDPALTLNYPEYNIKTTHVNGISVNLQQDTLKALSLVTIRGEVQNWDGSLKTDFDGVCYPLVFDKLSKFNTLANDPNARIKQYNIYNNSLFRGACTVTNGVFEFSFIVPLDINYQFGNGRISYYAQTNDNRDAHGYQNDIVIGGTADTFSLDNQGPIVKLFMNNNQFISGGITDENPWLYAELEDESGINATGNGVGHDITAILDENSPNPIVLNQYYTTVLNDFRKGTVRYPFYKLAEGRHTLSIKAWDIHNNSAEDETEFVVANSAKLALMSILNYPNPVTDKTCFSFETNKVNETLRVKIDIFAVNGALVKSIDADYESDGYRTACLEWDGLDNLGAVIANGVYVYRLSVVDQSGNKANQTSKLVLIK